MSFDDLFPPWGWGVCIKADDMGPGEGCITGLLQTQLSALQNTVN